MPPPFRSTASTLSEPEYSAQAFTSIVSGSRSLKLIWPQRRITAYHGFPFSWACSSPVEATITEAAETARNSRRVIESALWVVTESAPEYSVNKVLSHFSVLHFSVKDQSNRKM